MGRWKVYAWDIARTRKSLPSRQSLIILGIGGQSGFVRWAPILVWK
jgi:hypothetical protein